MTHLVKRFYRLSLLSAAVLFGAALLPGCGQSKSGFGEIDPQEFTTNDAAPDAPACAGLRCSRDLKKVLAGCDDAIVEECGEGQGCGDGRCIDACAAAEISKGSVGCAFATLPPDDDTEGTGGSCFAALISNTWDRPVTISALLGSEPLDVTNSIYRAEGSGTTTTYTRLEGPLPSKQVAIVFLSQSPHKRGYELHTRCPASVIPAYSNDPILHGTGKTRAFRLTTDAPVSAYSIYPYGGADSHLTTATLLLPLSSWDTNYVAMTPILGERPQVLQIVAAHDDTEVRARLPGAGDAVERWTLNHNEVAQLNDGYNLGGSFIEADKPIGLFGGNQCMSIRHPFACDTLQQQIPALSRWGSEYALVPYRPRTVTPDDDDTAKRENVPWRLVGAAAGTVLTYDSEPPGTAPLTLEAGEVSDFTTDKLLTVKSQDASHPFLASVHMTSGDYNLTLGDPDFVTVVPSDQFLDRYVFFVDYTYPETTLTVVRRKTATGFAPVYLDCGGEITTFRPLGTSGQYEYAWVYLTSGFKPQKFSGGQCGYGRNEARSEGPFSLTVWGIDSYTSYGYNGGTGSRPLSNVRAPVPK